MFVGSRLAGRRLINASLFGDGDEPDIGPSHQNQVPNSHQNQPIMNTVPSGGPNIKRVSACEGSAITKLMEPLNESNCMAWRECIKNEYFDYAE